MAMECIGGALLSPTPIPCEHLHTFAFVPQLYAAALGLFLYTLKFVLSSRLNFTPQRFVFHAHGSEFALHSSLGAKGGGGL